MYDRGQKLWAHHRHARGASGGTKWSAGFPYDWLAHALLQVADRLNGKQFAPVEGMAKVFKEGGGVSNGKNGIKKVERLRASSQTFSIDIRDRHQLMEKYMPAVRAVLMSQYDSMLWQAIVCLSMQVCFDH